jgi:protein O-GlcNAc transferase
MSEYTPRLQTAGRFWTALVRRAETALRNGQFAEALELIDQALWRNPEFPPAHALRGRILAAKRDWAGAADALRTAVRLDASDAKSWCALAYALHEQGEVVAAHKAINRALKLAPEQAEYFTLQGSILASAGQASAARAAFERALDLDPTAVSPRIKLAKLLFPSDASRAAAHLQLARQIAPSNVEVRLALGELLQRQGRLEEALEEYRAASARSPFQAEPYARLGEVFEAMRQPLEAASMYRAALAFNARLPHCHAGLARVYLDRDRWEQAAAIAQAGLMIAPDSDELQQLVRRARNRLEWQPSADKQREKGIAC